jgi:hypothetical protein
MVQYDACSSQITALLLDAPAVLRKIGRLPGSSASTMMGLAAVPLLFENVVSSYGVLALRIRMVSPGLTALNAPWIEQYGLASVPAPGQELSLFT